MDSLTLELIRGLQAGPYDEARLKRIREQLRSQRRLLCQQKDFGTLAEIVELLDGWAQAADTPRLRTGAIREAADIAERDLKQPALATELRARAAAPASAQTSVGAPAYAALGKRRAMSGDIDGAIDAYERALNADAAPENVRGLADLYAKRARPGDAQQAADLYATLGEALGSPDGITMLQRALEQQPDHAEARALLEQYIRAGLPAPIAQPAAPPPLPQARAAPGALRNKTKQARVISIVQHAANISLPAPPPASSLSPVVRNDELPEIPVASSGNRKRWAAGAAVLLSAAAAAVIFVVLPRTAAPKSIASSAPTNSVTTAVSAAPTAAPEPPVAAQPTAVAGSPTAIEPAPSVAAVAPEPTTDTAAPLAAAVVASAAGEGHGVEPGAPVAPAPTSEEPGVVFARLDHANLRGGKLTSAQLSAAIAKATPKLVLCYATSLKKKPRTKGQLTLTWTVRPNGQAVGVKARASTIKDASLVRCTTDAIGSTKFPKPRKQAVQIELPVEYRRS